MTTIDLEQETNPWQAQAARFDLAARKLNLDEGLWKVLSSPSREIIVHIPCKWTTAIWKSSPDSGCSIPLPAAPPRAACATHPTLTSMNPRPRQLDDWKCAVVNIPFGGQGGIICDPHTMSMGELERMTRRYTAELFISLAPKKMFPLPTSTPTNSHAWIMDT